VLEVILKQFMNKNSKSN